VQWLECVVTAITDASGGVVGLRGIARDVTARRRAEQRTLLLERAIESSSNGIVIVDAKRPDQPLIYVNAAFERITGYRAQDVLGLNCRFLQGPDVSQPELDRVRAALREQRACEVVLRNYTRQGALIWNQLSVAPVRDERGEVSHFVGVLNDVTERRRYESELAYLASHDPVTGLSRYVRLQEQVEALIARGGDTRFALLYVDIDRFHTVNETMGHVIGDAALRVVADRLRDGVGDPERVCRLASDEFLALVPGIGEVPDAAGLAQRIRQALDAPVEIGPYRLYLTCSIGISSYPDNGTTAADMLHAAEAAMTRAKRHGRDSVFAFTNDQANELQDRLKLGGRLREAIGNGEMVLHYQPQVSALSGEIVGVEALVRWQTQDLGLLPPGRFIRVAEELGLIVELGRWVLNEACRQLRAWSDAGLPAVPVAVNVSALQLHRPTFVDDVRDTLERHGLAARMLEIELTESAIMENVQRMVETMVALKRLGVRLALDDFGIGFSSLSYLKRFPLDKLKIDQSFVREVSHSPGDAGIVRAIVAMGHQLQLTVMAEGVESEAQLGYLRRNHCDQLQGMFLSAPLPADGAARLLQQRHLSLGAFVATAPHQTLLLLDDDQNILSSLARLLRRDGYQILLANDQQQAYDLLGRHPVQVIVSDQRMPDGTGTEFLSRVKDLYPDTVRMVLSGYTDLASVTEAINRGAIYKFLTKPWDDDELRARIQEAFRMHAQLLEARVADRKAG
jgi:diguanylate cyclase (GGDEF)-like protein/PAS domain S-box-containing protein